MYLRCSSESKPTWTGKSRALFQNNNSHRPAMRTRGICSSHRAVDLLSLTLPRKTATQANAISRIQNGQMFDNASSGRSPPAVDYGRPEHLLGAANTRSVG